MKLRRIKEFPIKENLEYSGEDVTKMAVIGKVITYPFGPFDEGEYDIVEIIDAPGGKNIYVCNKWYKEYKKIPQIIHSDLVKEYIPVEKFGNFY
ncbi:MAG: hypothetical protein EBS19_01320 [Spirochaetia bacterium]|nr:hypothetical protein [Spirochaetia bacterium]